MPGPRSDPAVTETSIVVESARVIEASARLVADRIDLARVEMEDAARAAVARAIRTLGVTVAFAASYALGLAALVGALQDAGLSGAAALAIGALVCAGTGAALARRTRAVRSAS